MPRALRRVGIAVCAVCVVVNVVTAVMQALAGNVAMIPPTLAGAVIATCLTIVWCRW